jgi:protein TonB
MQSLIQSGEKALKVEPGENLVEFVMLKEVQNLQIKQRQPKPPPPPDQPPPAVPDTVFNTALEASPWTMNPVTMEKPGGLSGPGLMISDGEYLPIVQVQPSYPRHALVKGLVGWVIIEFTVTESGSVSDPFVVANCAMVHYPGAQGECEGRPNSIFDTAALRAAKKFKYKPKVIDGIAMATAGVQNKITFELME